VFKVKQLSLFPQLLIVKQSGGSTYCFERTNLGTAIRECPLRAGGDVDAYFCRILEHNHLGMGTRSSRTPPSR
jgi:hypothetical protein